jgi:hypothetical protein
MPLWLLEPLAEIDLRKPIVRDVKLNGLAVDVGAIDG